MGRQAYIRRRGTAVAITGCGSAAGSQQTDAIHRGKLGHTQAAAPELAVLFTPFVAATTKS